MHLGLFRVSSPGQHVPPGPGSWQASITPLGREVYLSDYTILQVSFKAPSHCPGPGSLGILQDFLLPTLAPNNLLSTAKENRDSESQGGLREGKQLVQGHIGNLWPRIDANLG